VLPGRSTVSGDPSAFRIRAIHLPSAFFPRFDFLQSLRDGHDRQSRFSQRLNQRTSCVATADFFNTIGQNRTNGGAAIFRLFDHLVGSVQ
jgi:hypothetical protein